MTLPSVRLIHGDCLEVMPTLPAGSVQMVFADLPYGMVRRSWDQQISLSCLWTAWLRVARRNARFVLTAIMPFAADLIVSKRALFRHDLVWSKGRTTGFLNANKRPLRSHEHVLVFGGNKAVYNPQKVKGKPYSVTGRPADLNYMDNVKNDHVRVYDGMRFPTTTLAISSPPGKLHPTQKPVALLEWLIRTYSNEGDTVLDPTAGSMTTAIAALRTGRNVICIEKDAEYFCVGSGRVRAEQDRLASDLFGGRCADEQLRA